MISRRVPAGIRPLAAVAALAIVGCSAVDMPPETAPLRERHRAALAAIARAGADLDGVDAWVAWRMMDLGYHDEAAQLLARYAPRYIEYAYAYVFALAKQGRAGEAREFILKHWSADVGLLKRSNWRLRLLNQVASATETDRGAPRSPFGTAGHHPLYPDASAFLGRCRRLLEGAAWPGQPATVSTLAEVVAPLSGLAGRELAVCESQRRYQLYV